MHDTISVTGLVATPPKLTVTNAGIAILSFRLASGQRRFDRATERWTDGSTNWYSVTAFRHLATNAGTSIQKGDRIIVSGRLMIRRWENGERSGTSVDIHAESLGHDLLWGTTSYTKSFASSAAASAARSTSGSGYGPGGATPPMASGTFAPLDAGGGDFGSGGFGEAGFGESGFGESGFGGLAQPAAEDSGFDEFGGDDGDGVAAGDGGALGGAVDDGDDVASSWPTVAAVDEGGWGIPGTTAPRPPESADGSDAPLDSDAVEQDRAG